MLPRDDICAVDDWSTVLDGKGAKFMTNLSIQLFSKKNRAFDELTYGSRENLVFAALNQLKLILRDVEGNVVESNTCILTVAAAKRVGNWASYLRTARFYQVSQLLDLLFRRHPKCYDELSDSARENLAFGVINAIAGVCRRDQAGRTCADTHVDTQSQQRDDELLYLRQENESLRRASAALTKLRAENEDLKAQLQRASANEAALRAELLRLSEQLRGTAMDDLHSAACRAAEVLCAQHARSLSLQSCSFFYGSDAAARGNQRRFSPSPLFKSSHEAKRFMDTLVAHDAHRTLVTTSGELDQGKFELRFHGTTVDSAQSILVDGFDPSKRRRGQYGPGEYVGDYDTALAYESEKGDSGALLVVLLFTAAPGIVTHVPGHQIVVVNNPTDRSATYCVPLGTFCDESKTADILARLSAPFRGAPIANVTNSTSTVVPRAVHFRDDAGKWAPADPAVGHAVAVAQARGAATCKCVIGQFSYTIDLAAKTQSNDRTGKVRALRIA